MLQLVVLYDWFTNLIGANFLSQKNVTETISWCFMTGSIS